MSVSDILQQCKELLDMMPGEALAKAREKHPQVGGFGVFPVYAPLEIIHAAGLMPIGMFGAGNKVEISHADSRFQSFICSIAKSTLELFMRGDMKDMSGAVFSSICDVARNLSSLVRRNRPELYIDYLHLPQNLYSAASADYTRAEFERFRTNLSAHLGKPIELADITASLQLYNKVRSRIHALYAYRRDNPLSLTATELSTVIRAGTRMMPEDYVTLLDQLLEKIKDRRLQPRDSIEVVIEGAFCELPPLDLIEVIEDAGCRIKDDDMAVGWRLFKEEVPVNGDPVKSLADAYLSGSMSTSVRHDRKNSRSEGLTVRMKQAGANAVIFAPAKFCEPALLDYVLFRRKLDEYDIPHLKLEFEEKMWTFESSRTEVETFAESMLFD